MKYPFVMAIMKDFLLKIIFLLIKRMPARDVGRLFEKIQINCAGEDPRVGAYALEYNNPQALCFFIDAYPTLRKLFEAYPRMGCIRMLDVGPAFGAAAGLLAQMHRSNFLGPELKVDVLDVVADRRNFIEMSYPAVRFLHGAIESLSPEYTWDVAYCSNVIEHLEDPQNFLRILIERVKGYVVVLAPYREEEPMSLDHKVRICESTFDGLRILSLEKITTPAWPPTADGVVRQQVLVVLKGGA